MKKINYLGDDEDTIASHFSKSRRQVVSLSVRRYINDVGVHKKLIRATIKAKIIKLQEELTKL